VRQLYPPAVVATATPVPAAATPTPVAATPVPVVSTPVPVASTPVPVASTPVPVASTPAPTASVQTPQITCGPDRSYAPIYSTQIVAQNKVLVGADISDPSGVVASLLWTQVSGPTKVTFDSQSYRYASIRNLTYGTYVMKIEARNAAGLVVASAITKLTLEAP
jgi:hypothetical protein